MSRRTPPPHGRASASRRWGFLGFGGGVGLASDGERSSMSVSIGGGEGAVVSFGQQKPADHTTISLEGRASLRVGSLLGVSTGVDMDSDGKFSAQVMGAVGYGRFSKQLGFRVVHDHVNGWQILAPDFDRISLAAELDGRVTFTKPVDANLKPLIEHLNPFSIDEANQNEDVPPTDAQIRDLAPPGIVVTFAPNSLTNPGLDEDPAGPAPSSLTNPGLDEDPAGPAPSSLTNPGLDEDPAGPAPSSLTDVGVDGISVDSGSVSDDTTAPADTSPSDTPSDSPDSSDASDSPSDSLDASSKSSSDSSASDSSSSDSSASDGSTSPSGDGGSSGDGGDGGSSSGGDGGDGGSSGGDGGGGDGGSSGGDGGF